MAGFIQKLFSGFSGKKAESAEEQSERLQEYEQIFKLAKKKHLSDEKKAELEALYVQLIKKSDNATSGQLQFLGLDQIKEKMGDKWPRLQSKVYATAEDVIQRYISLSDIHFLFKEDRYVIIFTQSTDEEINRKVSTISAEIMRRLDALDIEELKFLQVKQEITKIDVNTFLESDFNDMLDYVFKQYTDPTTAPVAEIELSHFYLPLWDTEKKAFNAYICLASNALHNHFSTEEYKSLFRGKPLAEKTALDLKILEKTIDELEKMEIEGRKGIVICPVQHETIYNFTGYDEYKNLCQTIPNNQRESLVFLVTTSEGQSLPAKDTYWFITLLKEYCSSVFIDIAMRESLNFQSLKASGAQGMGIQFAPVFPLEEKNLSLLVGFNAQAKYFRMKKTFVLNIDTDTAANKLKRMGFTYLGGPFITDYVKEIGTPIPSERHSALLELGK